jgi:hypothetical protein
MSQMNIPSTAGYNFSAMYLSGRELLKEGELLKISRKGEVARYFILLNDCLLYTSYQVSLSPHQRRTVGSTKTKKKAVFT